MKIYTKTGDNGTTGLFGGPRISKSNTRIASYGTVDELNASIGLARSFLDQSEIEDIDSMLGGVQNTLFTLGADLATPIEAKVSVPRIEATHAVELEQWIDRLEEELPELTQFILPGGSSAGAALHLCRTICRRAERLAVQLTEEDAANSETIIYLNRLSDFLFVVSRAVNRRLGVSEETWSAS